jgi:hypothetical protein
MKTVDVLVGADAADHLVGVDVLRQRHLHENAVHCVVGVEPIDVVDQLRVRRLGWQPDGDAVHPRLERRLPLRSNVDGARRIVADEHDCQARAHPGRAQLRGLLADLLAHDASDRHTIDELSGQSRPPASRE